MLTNPLAAEAAGQHTPAGMQSLIAYLAAATGSHFLPHGSVRRGQTSTNDFDLVEVPQDNVDALLEAANAYEQELHDKVAAGLMTWDEMMTELYIGESKDAVTIALEAIGFVRTHCVEFDGSPTGTAGAAEVMVVRYENAVTCHAIEVWVPLANK